MKWVTRKKAMVDRIACPWLIKKFVDKEAQFIFGLNGQTASFWQPPIQCLPNNNYN